ncbi:MAG: hypothetical protein CVV34_05825 [Methanomicrobiales archaeon HGW-Methanomicrobiales-5]|nr:MAG: hypothetical protein CVV34_05825 [Methanomicrobiales archaeon HGW-Methanomicrobiales-5]
MPTKVSDVEGWQSRFQVIARGRDQRLLKPGSAPGVSRSMVRFGDCVIRAEANSLKETANKIMQA